jgi:inner membrane transporter RhtA
VRTGVLLPLVAAVAAMLAFQVGAAVAKQLFPAVGPQGAAALRLVFGAAMLLAFTRPWRGWPRDAPLWPVIALGLSVAAAMQCFYLSIERLPLGVAVSVQFMGPLAVAILHSRRPSDLTWVALAAVGVWMLTSNDFAGHIDLTGLGWALAAAAGWAGYIEFGRRAGARFGQSAGALATTIAAAVVAPLALARVGPALFAPELLPIALAVALLSTALPFSLELYALSRLPPRTFAVFTSLEPAFAVLSGLVLLQERLSLAQIAGVAMVIAAAAGAAWTSAEKTEAARVGAAP